MKFETLCHGYGLIEGPRVDRAGNLHFADVTNGGVFRRAPDGTISTVVPRRRGVGGIAIHADGGVVISGRDICHVRDGQTRSLFRREDIPGFNDLFTDASGRVYFGSIRSDPFRPGPRTAGELYRIELDGSVRELYRDVGLSNGIGFSPDGRFLYHSDTSNRLIWVHEIGENGDAVGRRPFAEGLAGPDGLAVDEAGAVWVALYENGVVARYAPDGRLDRTIEVPAGMVTSVCFGGSDRQDLYVVTADNREAPERNGTVFRARAEVAGLAAPLARV